MIDHRKSVWPLHFAIWIRWWLKRKLKRNPLSFSAAVPRLPLRINFPPKDSCLGVKPYNRAARPLPNECPSREWSPHRNASNPRKATSTLVHFIQQLAPHASIEAESRIVQALRRTRRFVSHRGKHHFTPIFVLPAERIARTVPWPGTTASLSDSALVRGL